ncbi:hypothetical protein L7F22_026412 [Adiantum nelumboides]|nr:hypothetical protein [Adiantum nelumboides]
MSLCSPELAYLEILFRSKSSGGISLAERAWSWVKVELLASHHIVVVEILLALFEELSSSKQTSDSGCLVDERDSQLSVSLDVGEAETILHSSHEMMSSTSFERVVALLLADTTLRRNSAIDYTPESLHQAGCVKVAGEAVMEAVVHINGKDGPDRTEHKNYDCGETVEGGDGDLLKETTFLASNQGTNIGKEDSLSKEEDLKIESTLQFVMVELWKKRKKQVEDELSHVSKRSASILVPKNRTCKKL